ncbi:hypothetical protein L798_03376 [Zootermopsis nevadensis]|uniref:C2H2-type domain-containing protein n=1 Tax=Zootermopsis nevadensis TaxID=136037 RepID=A0A067QGQ7_ZOONE|nr:hypothetical protein L798_03376 [Zootermopsis nevadensis]
MKRESPNLSQATMTRRVQDGTMIRRNWTMRLLRQIDYSGSSKGFITRDKLVAHNRKHTGDKPFKCEVCTKSFTLRGVLVAHMRIHNADKPFKCEFCNKRFGRLDNLVPHISTHTGEKAYKCEVCPKSFARKGHLMVHNRIHTGYRPYKCDYCCKSYTVRRDLDAHVRTHTGDRPYKCDECGKGFTQRGALGVHIRSHTVATEILKRRFGVLRAFSNSRSRTSERTYQDALSWDVTFAPTSVEVTLPRSSQKNCTFIAYIRHRIRDLYLLPVTYARWRHVEHYTYDLVYV